MPVDLLADEKHAKAHGEKWYIATTVAQDCVLGASVSATADLGVEDGNDLLVGKVELKDGSHDRFPFLAWHIATQLAT